VSEDPEPADDDSLDDPEVSPPEDAPSPPTGLFVFGEPRLSVL
jgi:hypothetical protein